MLHTQQQILQGLCLNLDFRYKLITPGTKINMMILMARMKFIANFFTTFMNVF